MPVGRVKVDLSRYQGRHADDPNDPYQFKRCYSCARNDHDNCDHVTMNVGAVDALDFITVRCICQCFDDGWELMREGHESHVGVTTERQWSRDLDSTKVTLTLAIPNLYLTQAVIGRNQDGKVIKKLEEFYRKLGSERPTDGERSMTIEDLALIIGHRWEASVESFLIDLIAENRRIALAEEMDAVSDLVE